MTLKILVNVWFAFFAFMNIADISKTLYSETQNGIYTSVPPPLDLWSTL